MELTAIFRLESNSKYNFFLTWQQNCFAFLLSLTFQLICFQQMCMKLANDRERERMREVCVYGVY